jgi:hypothetical protein
LTESFKEICPEIDHRVCIRHIYTNFRDSGHREKALKDKLWAAASAYTGFEFDAHMVELKKLSPPAYNYLSKIPVATWSRSKFTTNPKSDLIVNNLSECFNSYILDARDKSILTMLDTIRRKLMRRFQVNRAFIAKMSEKLCLRFRLRWTRQELKQVNACFCILEKGSIRLTIVRDTIPTMLLLTQASFADTRASFFVAYKINTNKMYYPKCLHNLFNFID